VAQGRELWWFNGKQASLPIGPLAAILPSRLPALFLRYKLIIRDKYMWKISGYPIYPRYQLKVLLF
jgi:hypothetical protein